MRSKAEEFRQMSISAISFIADQSRDAIILFRVSDLIIINSSDKAAHYFEATKNSIRNNKISTYLQIESVLDEILKADVKSIRIDKNNNESKGTIIATATSFIDGDERYIILFIEKEEHDAKLGFERKLKIEEALSKISTSFLTVTPSTFDNLVNQALQLMGQITRADNIYVFEASGKGFHNTHEWVNEGIVPFIDIKNDADSADFSWIHDQLRNFQNVYIPDIDAMDDSQAKLRGILKGMGIKSTLTVPIRHEDTLAGFLGFDSIKKHKVWNEEDIRLLRVVGEIFSYALQRIKADKKLKKVNRQLKKLNAELEKQVEIRTESLTLSYKKLKAANRELDNFVYRAAHDLKGPLKRLLGLIYVASMERSHDFMKIENYLHKFKLTALSMDEGLTKLLISNQIDNCIPEKDIVDLHQLVLKSKDEIEEHFGIKKVKLITTNTQTDVIISYFLLGIIIRNLMENAYLFAADFSAKPIVEVAYERVNGFYIITITDNGTGIEPDILSNVKDMFFRGSNITGGSGLGLYLVDKALKKLNGIMNVNSITGKTKVVVKLPIVE